MPRNCLSQWKTVCGRLICGLLALLVLNSSIDTPAACDVLTGHGKMQVEDESYNDIESFLELFTECLLDLEDFMPEHDNDANDIDNSYKAPQHWIAAKPTSIILPTIYTFAKPQHAEIAFNLPHVVLDSSTPPPDSLA